MKCPKCGTPMELINTRWWCKGDMCGNTLGVRDIAALADEIAKWRARYHTARNKRDALVRQLEHEAQCQSLLRDERDGYRAVAEQRAREVERLANEMRALLIPANDSTSLADTGTPPLQYSRLSGTDMARYVDLEYGYVCYANAKSRPVCFSLSAETK